jgi:hypothetical protein
VKTLFHACAALLALGVAAGCTGRDVSGGIPTLDLEAAIDNPRALDLSEIAGSIGFIPLDDGDGKSLVGTVGELQESASGFYICEGFTFPVMHFDKTGRFVSTIGRIGRGPDETAYIVGMGVDHRTGNVYITGLNSTIVAYDPEGRMFARNDSVANTYGFVYHNDRLISLRHDLATTWDHAAETMPFIDIYSDDMKSEGTIYTDNLGPGDFFFTDRRSGAFGIGSKPVISDNGENLLVMPARSDTVFHYNAGALDPVYLLRLGRHAFPVEGYGVDPVVERGGKFTVDNMWEGGRYVIVSADNYQRLPSGERIPGRRLVFDMKNLSAGGFSATGGTESAPGLFVGGIAFTPMYIRDNRLVGYMQALDIADGRDAGSITDPDLAALASTIKEDSNPVIVVAELK